MSLINELLHRPIDPGYAAATERRRRAGDTAPQRPTGLLVLVTTVVIGLIFAVSSQTLGARETERSVARVELVAQIEARQERVEANSVRVGELQQEIAQAQEQILLDSAGPLTAGASNRLLVASGAIAVQGPGIVITMDDAPRDPDASTSTQNESRVLSRDLQIVVNALWAAGAEAIDVGGQRLTSRSAIRFAGEAILVNYRPLNRPYEVRAIGDPQRLATEFARGDGGSYLKALSDNFGIRTSIQADENIMMKSASAIRIENATPLTPGGPQ